MKYWICPACSCVNAQTVIKCDGCGVSALGILLLPTKQWVEFNDIDELDKWIAMMRKIMSSKVWRKFHD